MRTIDIQRIAILVARELEERLDEVMTVAQVAEYLGLARKTILNKANAGELPYKKKFGRLYFSKKAITEYCLG